MAANILAGFSCCRFIVVCSRGVCHLPGRRWSEVSSVYIIDFSAPLALMNERGLSFTRTHTPTRPAAALNLLVITLDIRQGVPWPWLMPTVQEHASLKRCALNAMDGWFQHLTSAKFKVWAFTADASEIWHVAGDSWGPKPFLRKLVLPASVEKGDLADVSIGCFLSLKANRSHVLISTHHSSWAQTYTAKPHTHHLLLPNSVRGEHEREAFFRSPQVWVAQGRNTW